MIICNRVGYTNFLNINEEGGGYEMAKKNSVLINLSEKLLKLAPSLAHDTACIGAVGEPKLPKKLKG